MCEKFNGKTVDDLIRLIRFGGVIVCMDGQSERCEQFGTKAKFIGRVCKFCNKQRSRKQYREKKVLADFKEIIASNNISTEELDPELDEDVLSDA